MQRIFYIFNRRILTNTDCPKSQKQLNECYKLTLLKLKKTYIARQPDHCSAFL